MLAHLTVASAHTWSSFTATIARRRQQNCVSVVDYSCRRRPDSRPWSAAGDLIDLSPPQAIVSQGLRRRSSYRSYGLTLSNTLTRAAILQALYSLLGASTLPAPPSWVPTPPLFTHTPCPPPSALLPTHRPHGCCWCTAQYSATARRSHT